MYHLYRLLKQYQSIVTPVNIIQEFYIKLFQIDYLQNFRELKWQQLGQFSVKRTFIAISLPPFLLWSMLIVPNQRLMVIYLQFIFSFCAIQATHTKINNEYVIKKLIEGSTQSCSNIGQFSSKPTYFSNIFTVFLQLLCGTKIIQR